MTHLVLGAGLAGALALAGVLGAMAWLRAQETASLRRDLESEHARRLAAETERTRLARTLESMPQGVLVTDPRQPDNPIVYANHAVEALCGYRRDELVGKNARLLQGKDTDPGATAAMRAAVREGRGCAVEVVNYRKGGEPWWNAVAISPIRDESGAITEFVAVLRDVTEEKATRARLVKTQRTEAIGRMAGGIAHDFNNVLTAVAGNTELLIETLPESHPGRPLAHEVARAAGRAAMLTRQLLAFTRQQVLEPTLVNVNAVVASMHLMIRRLIGEEIEVALTLGPDLARIVADRSQIEQVVLNLAVNARDAMPHGGRLTIETADVVLDEAQARRLECAAPGPHVLLTVGDTGHGMDEETRAQIFEPFFTTRPLGEGTGLGLATVHGIVRQSGGGIAVETAPDRGTRFLVYLPAAQGEAHAGAEAPAPPRVSLRGRETVLIVEDEPAVRALAERSLRRYGYTVLCAAGGEAAIEMAAAHPGPIDLLVTDIVMPGMRGPAIAARLRAQRPDVKVLFVSGYAPGGPDDQPVLEAGSAFLAKPFGLESLVRKARELLDGAAPPR